MKFAIIGATGNVGRKTIDILEKSKLDFSNISIVFLPTFPVAPIIANFILLILN